MATPEIEQYIKNELARGTDWQDIESSLKQSGWNQAEINRAYGIVENRSDNEAQTHENSDASPENRSPGRDNTSLPGAFALFGETFRFIASRFLSLLGVTFTFAIIAIAVYFIFSSTLNVSIFATLSFTPSELLQFIGQLPVTEVLGVLTAFVIVMLVVSWGLGSFLIVFQSDQPSPRKAIAGGFAYIIPLFILSIILQLTLNGAFYLLIIPGLIFTVWFSFTFFVAVDENKQGYAALLRSRDYIRGHEGGVLGRLFVLYLPIFIIGFVLLIMGLGSGAGGLVTLSALIATSFIFNILVILYAIVAIPYTYLLYTHLKKINPYPKPSGRVFQIIVIAFTVWGFIVPFVSPYFTNPM